jgi:glycosyltransferase involved in cell wall biosynthesis
MHIAQIAPLHESVPPRRYGGTERVVATLTEELQRLGHDVTLFASGDSVTSARLVPGCARALRLDEQCLDHLAPHVLMVEQLCQQADAFDLIHFHLGYLHFPLARRQCGTHLTTMHGRLDMPELQPLFREYLDIPLVSISESQRTPMPWADWRGTVYHGLPEDLYRFRPEPGSYLAFLGRLTPEKRADRAIHIAKEVGIPLKIAAKLDRGFRDYFESELEPLFDHPLVEYLGEIDDHEKDEFLGNALALLFPIDWPEPFGLVMIEAMACGTPVIAYRHGAVDEVMEHGTTGFVVTSIEEAIEATRRVPEISRQRCRAVFEERFTAARMAADYVALYERMVLRESEPRASLVP